MQIEQFLSRLTDVTKSGDGWVATCPAHNDRHPSLGISVGKDDRILVHCRSQHCSTDAIAGSIGLSMSDLYPKHRSPDPGTPYEYMDANGEIIYRVVRRQGKHWVTEHPDGKGGWSKGLGEARRVLYRLPVVEACASANDPDVKVFLAEGEKDVDNLETLCLCATTNPFGANTWRDEYNESLCGAYVVILPDNDEPGRKHAHDVARRLNGIATSVKVLELPGLPEAGDVSDWIAEQRKAGLDDQEIKNALESLAEACPEYSKPAGVLESDD